MKYLKQFTIAGAALLMWLSTFFAFAQTPAPGIRQELRQEQQNVRNETRLKAQNIREETRVKSQEIRQELKTKVEGDKQEIQAKRKELQKELQQKREEAKNRLEAARQEAKERLKAQREEFKKKLAEIKDERKRAIASRLEAEINRLNERWTTHFTNVLNRLEDILGKVQLRADKAVSLGKDVSAVKTSINEAKIAISSARTAVETQANKNYTITFASEEQLKTAFRDAKNQLHKDLTALRDNEVKNAKSRVQNAAQKLASIPAVDEEPKEEAASASPE